MGWGGECEEKGKTHEVGYPKFNRTAKEANSNNNNTNKKNIQNQGNTQSSFHCPMPCVPPGHD